MKAFGSLRLFYGWWVTLALLMVLFFSHGIGYYVLPVALKPLSAEFQWSRTAVSGVVSVFSLALGLLAPLVGRLCDRYGARKVMLAALPLFAVGLGILSLTHSLWQLYAFYALISIGIAGLHTVSVSCTITKWFSRRQGTATGVAFSGLSLGGLVMAPLAGYLIALWGWRATYIVLGMLSWVAVLPLLLLVVKNRPEDKGLCPDGQPSGEARGPLSRRPSAKGSPAAPPGAVLSLPLFWLATVSFFLVNIAFIGVLTHQVAFLTDIGVAPSVAASALGLTAGFGILGKLGAGYLGDKMPRTLVAVLFFALEGLGVLVLLAQRGWFLWLFVILFGVAMGANAVVRPLVIAELFGSALFGTAYGWVVFFSYFGIAFGAPFAGYVYDHTGSYYGAFVTFTFAYLGAVVALLACHYLRPRSSPKG